jgi:hypothetical protein
MKPKVRIEIKIIISVLLPVNSLQSAHAKLPLLF